MEWTPADDKKRLAKEDAAVHNFMRSTSVVSWTEVEVPVTDHVCWQNLMPTVPQETGGTKW